MTINVKVLIVDDSDFDRNLLTIVFKSKGFQVSGVDCGSKCFEEIEKSKPDIVLLDIMMPEMNGQDVLHEIRKKYNSIELPDIMVTSKSDASDIVELLCLGANDYIVKPVDFEIALMRIMTQVKIGILSKEMSRLKEIEAIGAMIATYNHEINNPLSVAFGCLKSYAKNKDEETFEKLDRALWRIAEIVKRIDGVMNSNKINYENYAHVSKMVKIN
jgi:CheY-like chemotaxis protein